MARNIPLHARSSCAIAGAVGSTQLHRTAVSKECIRKYQGVTFFVPCSRVAKRSLDV